MPLVCGAQNSLEWCWRGARWFVVTLIERNFRNKDEAEFRASLRQSAGVFIKLKVSELVLIGETLTAAKALDVQVL